MLDQDLLLNMLAENIHIRPLCTKAIIKALNTLTLVLLLVRNYQQPRNSFLLLSEKPRCFNLHASCGHASTIAPAKFLDNFHACRK